MLCEKIIRDKAEYSFYVIAKKRHNIDINIYSRCSNCNRCNIEQPHINSISNIYKTKYIGFHTFHISKLIQEHKIFQEELSELKYNFLKKFIFLFFTENKYFYHDITQYILSYY